MTTVDLANLLKERRDEIVARFVAEVRQKNLPPAGVARPRLVDHIPAFLDETAAELSRAQGPRPSHEAIETRAIASAHGVQRWALGYDLQSIVREYGLLRQSILETARDHGVPISLEQFDALGRCLSLGVGEAVSSYERYRDEELNAEKANLQYLADAGQLLSASLDQRSTIASLLRLIIPRMADWCAVHVEGMAPEDQPVAHVDPASVETIRKIYGRFPSSPDAGYGFAEVIRSGTPVLVTEVPEGWLEGHAESPEHLEILRRINTCSWMIVPLRVQEHTFGALTLAYSDSRRRYKTADLVLAGDLARRAAAAIDNARLYELSQNERSRVEAATRAKDEFVAMVSHELRTPLNAILGWVRITRSGRLDEPKRAHAFEVIERNAVALNQLVADLLDISRAMTGRIRLNPSQVDLGGIVDLVVEEARLALEAKRIQVHTQLDRERAVMRGDGERLQQIVWNLVTNALKFTPKGGEIRITLQRVESDLELTVHDTGVGISSDFLPHVFDSFRQSDSSTTRVHGGLGIGLSITKHLVDLHGGSITAFSEGAGKGAAFVVRLPISPVVSTTLGVPKVPATTQGPPPSGAFEDLAGVRVLVVDDDSDARELVTVVLEMSGVEVRAAGTATEALALLEEATPDVVISDIGLPDRDGYALIRSIRTLADDGKKNVPVIALTAFAHNDDRTRALVAGFNRHLGKPVEPAALVKAVADVIGSGRGVRET